MQNIWYYEVPMVHSSRERKEKGNGKGVRMGFVLETHSRPWVPDLIPHFVVAFKHCSSPFEGGEVPNLPLPGSRSLPGIKAPVQQRGGCLLAFLEPLRSQ